MTTRPKTDIVDVEVVEVPREEWERLRQLEKEVAKIRRQSIAIAQLTSRILDKPRLRTRSDRVN